MPRQKLAISRRSGLTIDHEEIARRLWLSLWRLHVWPLGLVRTGDALYWYQTSCRALLWKTEVIARTVIEYESTAGLLASIEEETGECLDRDSAAIVRAPLRGWCLAYRVEPVARLFVPRPDGVTFSPFGWATEETPGMASWLRAADNPSNHLPLGGRVRGRSGGHGGRGDRAGVPRGEA